MFNQKIKKGLLCATLISSSVLITNNVSAANWLMLQGTEPALSAKRVKLWGFIQPQYQYDNSDPFVTGAGDEVFNAPKLIGPQLDDQSAFNIRRARIGVRGANFPLDSNTNYFLLVELGNNGITQSGGSFAHVTDASITLNHIPHARFRLGLFKTPGSDESLQAIHVFDYINFTSVTNQLLLERFPDKNDVNVKPNTTPDADLNQISNPVGAFRDVGIQVFDTFKVNSWELSYAFMIGNGNGLRISDNDKHKNYYGYLSAENVFKGKGARRQGWKSFVWIHDGKRTNAFDKSQTENRKRYGIGTKYLSKPFRVTAEYKAGKGMIFQGPNRPQHLFNNNDASGWYIEGGFYIPNTNFEIDLRYDSYTREENHPKSKKNDESHFDTWTIGAQYHLNKKTRINIEYAVRNFDSDTAAVNNHLKGVDGRFGIQLLAIY